MKRAIIIGSVFACFLMLMMPNIAAVEGTMIKNIPSYVPEYSKEELKIAIHERIEQFKEQEKDISFFGLDWNDPDGAFEGGLDDLTDVCNLVYGLYWSGLGLMMIRDGYLRNSENILDVVDNLIMYGDLSLLLFILFGEAFDVVDFHALDNR